MAQAPVRVAVTVALACLLAAASVAPLARVSALLSASKISIHSGLGAESWRFLNGAQPRVIKILDSFSDDDMQKIKALVPGIRIVGRIYLNAQPQLGTDPTAAAQQWWATVQHTVLGAPAVDYWEGYNEPDTSGVANMAWLGTFDAARVMLLAQYGLKASIGNFAVGTPDITDPAIIPPFFPAIDAALVHGGIMGVHEYANPTLSADFSGNTSAGDGWLTGRYRKLYRQYLIPTNRTIPLVISENGIDTVNAAPVSGGWRNYCGLWSQPPYSEPDCPAFYTQQLAWYDAVLRADHYVLGSTVFTLDIPGDWASYDVGGQMTTDLIAYLNSQQ